MAKVKLDQTVATTTQCPAGKKKIDLWDTHIAGFILEVRAGGSKTYALRYIDETGRQRQQKIGRFEDITCAQARKIAEQVRSKVVQGGNPAAEKETRKAIPTYAALAGQHLAHAKTYQKAFDFTEMIIRVHILPKWGKMKLNEIKPQAIALWLKEKHETGLAPATVDRIRAQFHRSFELARQWQVAGAEPNPVHSVPRRKYSNARDRYLTPEEAARLQAAVSASPNPMLRFIIGLLLFTGARRNELLKAKWEHIDTARRLWHIPDSKTGKNRYVPLSQPALDLIAALPRRNEWLLPNPDTALPYEDIKRAWTTARDAADLSGLRLHDLRHAAASFMCAAGVDLYTVGRILGHASHTTTMRYSHLADDKLLQAVEAGAAKMALAA